MSRWTDKDLTRLQQRRLEKGKPMLRVVSETGGPPRSGNYSKGEEAMEDLIETWSILPPVREFRFFSPRRWRFDFAWPDDRVAVEVEGIHYSAQKAGRHQRGDGFVKDCEKYLFAQHVGWTVVRVPSTWLSKQDMYAEHLQMVRDIVEMKSRIKT